MRCDLKLIKKVEIEYKELDGDGASHGGHVHARDFMVPALHTGAGIQC